MSDKTLKDISAEANTLTDYSNVFAVLNAINVNDKKEEKNGLSYLSWAWAWGEVKKILMQHIRFMRMLQGGVITQTT